MIYSRKSFAQGWKIRKEEELFTEQIRGRSTYFGVSWDINVAICFLIARQRPAWQMLLWTDWKWINGPERLSLYLHYRPPLRGVTRRDFPTLIPVLQLVSKHQTTTTKKASEIFFFLLFACLSPPPFFFLEDGGKGRFRAIGEDRRERRRQRRDPGRRGQRADR